MQEFDVARMVRHQSYQKKHLPVVEKLFATFQNKIENNEIVNIINTHHKNKRSFERAVSKVDMMTVISEGDIIETSKINETTYDVLIMSYIKSKSTIMYRPLHVSAVFHADKDTIVIKTVYDPRSKAEQWTNNFTERVFFK